MNVDIGPVVTCASKDRIHALIQSGTLEAFEKRDCHFQRDYFEFIFPAFSFLAIDQGGKVLLDGRNPSVPSGSITMKMFV